MQMVAGRFFTARLSMRGAGLGTESCVCDGEGAIAMADVWQKCPKHYIYVAATSCDCIYNINPGTRSTARILLEERPFFYISIFMPLHVVLLLGYKECHPIDSVGW